MSLSVPSGTFVTLFWRCLLSLQALYSMAGSLLVDSLLLGYFQHYHWSEARLLTLL